MNLPYNKVITALRLAAARIETDPSYSWTSSESCNMGILVQEALGLDKKKVISTMNEGWSTHVVHAVRDSVESENEGTWERRCCMVCQLTGEPVYLLIKQLVAIGFDRKDLKTIESLSNPMIWERMKAKGITLKDWQSPCDVREQRPYVAAYMRELALVYAERQAAQMAAAPIAKTSATPANNGGAASLSQPATPLPPARPRRAATSGK